MLAHYRLCERRLNSVEKHHWLRPPGRDRDLQRRRQRWLEGRCPGGWTGQNGRERRRQQPIYRRRPDRQDPRHQWEVTPLAGRDQSELVRRRWQRRVLQQRLYWQRLNLAHISRVGLPRNG